MLGTAKVRENASERVRGVERELVAGVEVDDAHMVAHRIEATDLGEVRLAHQTGVTRRRPAPGARRGDDRSDAAHPVG